jgi:hypothetical protein
MQQFQKTIQGISFSFLPVLEGEDEVCRVSAEGQNFKMTTNYEGIWEIRQQVPNWVKKLEQELGEAIDAENLD